METKKEKEENTVKEEEEKLNKIEDTINDMLDKVMEEKDDSLVFFDDELEDESFKLSRHSTRHQTTAKSIANFSKNLNNMHYSNSPNFDRANKRNLTVNTNQIFSPSFNNSFNSFNNNSNLPLMKNPFNNNYIPSLFNNNNIGFNNNLNQSFQSNNTFNSPNSNNILNNSMNKIEFIRNSLPYSKTVVYHNNQGNIFNNLGNNILQPNFYNINNNNNTNMQMPFTNNNNNTYIPINFDFGFKRGENRKKTYDTPVNLQNNIINYINNNVNNMNNNNNSICFKNQLEGQLLNNNIYISNIYNKCNNSLDNVIRNNSNEMVNNNINNNNENITNNCSILNNNNNNANNNNNSISDTLLFELKHLLERSGKIDFYIYNFTKGKFVSIIKNHKGSKIFQKYLKSTHSDEILHLIFLELSNNLEELIIDPYANYFCKKFFTYLNQKDRVDFLKCIEKSFIKLSSDSIGTYPIQTIIEHLNNKTEKNLIISAIKDRFEELIYDPFGCHVLEKILICFDDEYNTFIYSYIFDNFLYISNNNNGIYVIKKILTLVNKKKLHDKLKNIVKENALYLIQQPFANFVIQVIVESWSDYRDIINLYKGHFFKLSLEKYASNVIERCIEKDEEILNEYIDEIVNSNCIFDVMKSNFGNYVIQKALKLAKGKNKNKLVFSAAKDINKLNDNKLIQKWKSILSPHIKELNANQTQELKSQNYFNVKK